MTPYEKIKVKNINALRKFRKKQNALQLTLNIGDNVIMEEEVLFRKRIINFIQHHLKLLKQNTQW